MKTNLRTVLLGIVVLAMSSMIATAQAPKKYLFEYFTGAWCQFCPNGALTIQGIAAANPDVIFIGVHGGNGTDNMKTADGTALIQAAQVTGFPSGMLDRFAFNANDGNGNPIPPVVVWDAGNWQNILNGRRQMVPSSPVAISASGSFNPGNRELTVRVTGEFASALSGDIRLNAILIEDSVSGFGLGWDQVNAFNNQNGHPYFGKGNPIVGYQHRNVFRANMGGLWGKPNSLPTSITAGSTHFTDMTFTIPAGWNVDRLYVIPVVQRFNALFSQREILNSDKVPVSTLKPRTTVVNFAGNEFSIRPINEAGSRTAAVQNVTVENTEYTVSISKSASTPSDWTASITENGTPVSGNVMIAANMTKTFAFSLSPGATPGYGEATFNVTHPNGQTFSQKVAVLSNTVRALNISSNPASTIDDALVSSGKNHFASIPAIYVANNHADFSALANLKTVVWIFAAQGVLTPQDATLMNSLYDKGVNIMFGGELYVAGLQGLLTNPTTNPNPLLGKMGTSFAGQSTIPQSTGTIYTLLGVNGDPITAGMSIPFTISNYKTTILAASGTTSPILRLQDNNDVLGVRNEVNGRGRTIALGFNPANISNPQTKTQFIDACVTWLEGAIGSGPAPKITASVPSLSFGAVAVDATKEMTLTITNTGEGDLILTGNLFLSGDSPNFDIKSGDILNNVNLKKDESHEFVLKFTPDEAKQYSSKFQIFSNDPNASTLEIPVSGVGGSGPSVVANVQSIDFKGVQVQTTTMQTITLTNTGSTELLVSAINLTGTDAAAYSITEGKPGTTPISVAPSATTTFKVQFAPTQVRPYNANVVVVSNAAANLTIAMSGEGTPPTSVRAVSNDGLFEMKLVGQNPIASVSALEFTLGASLNGEAVITIVDASGATVQQIGRMQLGMGTKTLPFSVASLASGAYTVVANVNGVVYTIPVRVTR